MILLFGAPFTLRAVLGDQWMLQQEQCGFLVDLGRDGGVFSLDSSLLSCSVESQFLCFKAIQTACEKTQAVRD